MNRSHRLPAALGLAALLALPAPAAATHMDCTWGAHADVDPFAAEPLRYGVAAPTWGCPGPDVRVTVMGEELVSTWEEDPAGAPPPSAGPPAVEEPPVWLDAWITPRRARAGRVLRLRLTAAWIGDGRRRPAAGLTLRAAGRSARTGPAGTARLRLRPRRAGVLRPVVLHGRARVMSAKVTISGRRR